MSRFAGLVLLIALLSLGCFRPDAKPARVVMARAAHGSGDAEAVGNWLLAELLAPGGTNDGVIKARAELARLEKSGLSAALARALDGDVHGRFPAAAEGYLAVIAAARTSSRAETALVAWFAAARLEALRPAVAGLWKKSEAIVRRAIAEPGPLGWRARASLIE